MTEKILIVYLIIQFIVQLMIYKTIFKILNKIYIILPKYLRFSGFDDSIIKTINDKYIQAMGIICFGLNILISIFVKLFTSSGGATGMTNLFASVLLGFVIYIDINRLKKIESK